MPIAASRRTRYMKQSESTNKPICPHSHTIIVLFMRYISGQRFPKLEALVQTNGSTLQNPLHLVVTAMRMVVVVLVVLVITAVMAIVGVINQM